MTVPAYFAALRRIIVAVCLLGLPACSKDMQEQPSFGPQEAPRKHSPPGSVPIQSRAVLTEPPARTPDILNEGARLFAINCAHCHGPSGHGDGPVAGELSELPANLQAPAVQKHPASTLYEIVTDGKEAMPGFKGELSAKERWAVAYFVKSLPVATATAEKRP